MKLRPVTSPAFVGRAEEIAALVGYARESACGRGGCVLIEGDAGIGKSRLLDELRARLSGLRPAIASGACYEFGAAPYQPFVEILAALGASDNFVAYPTQAEQFAAVLERLERVCAHRSTICLIEDLHWADEATLQLLTYVARRIERYRLLLVLTVRSDALRCDPLVTGHVGKIARASATSWIRLRPLESAEIGRLLRHALDGRAALGRDVLERIAQRSEGNPFFAEELLKSAIEHVDAGGTSERRDLPLTIRAMVVDRLRLFDAAQRRVLTIAAAIGRPFTLAFLERIAETTQAEVLGAVRLACEQQLLAEAAGEPITYHFRHALTREAVGDEMLIAESRPLHRRIAQEIEATTPDHAADIGYHYWCAREPEPAQRYNECAGLSAERSHAYADAVRFYERALEMTESAGALRARVLAGMARCLMLAGEPERAMRSYGVAMDIYRASGQLTEAASLSYSLIMSAHFFGDGARALALAQAALATVPAERDALEANQRTHLRLCLAYIRADLGHGSIARAILGEVERVVPADASIAVTSMLENTRMHCALGEGDVDGGIAAAGRYRAVVARSGDGDYATRAHINIGAHFLAIGRDEQAGREFALALDGVQARRWTAFEGYTRALEAQRLFRLGALREARAMLERAAALPIEMSLARANIATAALLVGGALGDDAFIDAVVDPGVLDQTLRSGAVFQIGPLLGAYARRLAERDGPAAGTRLLATMLTGEEHPLAFGTAFVAAARYGDRAVIDRVRGAFARADSRLMQTAVVRAHRALFEAFAVRRFGDPDAAAVHAGEARAGYADLGWRYDVAIAHEAAGERDAALALYGEIGAFHDVRRLERISSSAGVRVRGGLSDREREIALLVADGATNKTIALRLAIGEKTIEKHLSSIYRKLGFSKRTQLTAFVVRDAERTALPG